MVPPVCLRVDRDLGFGLDEPPEWGERKAFNTQYNKQLFTLNKNSK
jgi:hypothetical protein